MTPSLRHPRANRWRNLLWVDCTAGAVVGALVLLLSGWLSGLYGLPRGVFLFTGAANLAYASFSFSLAVRSKRPLPLIVLLVAANLAWAAVMVYLAALFRTTASPLGLAHLIGEALFVGGLGLLEWRWRNLLLRRDAVVEPYEKSSQKQ